MGRDLKPIDANAEAVEILTYPEAPESIAPESALEDALERMADESAPLIPVVGEDGLCGLLTADNTAEFVLVRAALGYMLTPPEAGGELDVAVRARILAVAAAAPAWVVPVFVLP